VDRSDPGTCEHGNNRFRDHGHVDDHTVSLRHPPFSEPACARCNEVPEFPVTESADGGGDRAVIDKSGLIPVPVFNMAIKAIIAGIQDTPLKPFVIRAVGVLKNLIPLLFPDYFICSMPPEFLRIFN
jgi:hypothetical protein